MVPNALLAKKVHYPKKPYFLCHSVGPKPKLGPNLDKFNQCWIELGGEAWHHWPSILETFSNELSNLLNTPASQVCPQVNVSAALVKILNSFELNPRRPKILLCEEDFPTIGFAILKASGLELEFIPKEEDLNDLNTWEKYLSDDFAFAHIPHVTSHTGQLTPIKEILNITNDLKILSIIDVAQSIGAVEIDLSETKYDFVIGSCIKWLSGGPGAGFLIASNKMIELANPTDVGWFSHENPFEKDIHNFRYAKNAYKFFGGTPSIIPFANASDSLMLINSLISDSTYFKLIDELNEHFYSLLIEHQISFLNDFSLNKRSRTFIINDKKVINKFDQLNDSFFLDQCPLGVRVSLNYYNTVTELEEFFKLLK